MLILSLLVLQVLPASFCLDVELKGSLNIANNLFGSGALRQPSELVSRLLSYLPSKIVGKGKLLRADTIASPFLTTSNNAKNEEKTQLQTPLESILEALPSLLENKNTKETLTQSKNKSQKTDLLQESDSSSNLEHFMNHLKKTGKQTIDSVASYIKEELNIKTNVTHIVKKISDDYTDMLQNYYDDVIINVNDHDRDSLYLNMIETSHRLLFNETSKLLNDIVMHEDHNHHAHGSYKKINNELLRFSYIYKRDIMRYVYDTYNIPKEYPVNSEYEADIIIELTMLNDKQFLTILQTLTKILKDNDNIIARIVEKQDRDLMKAKLRDCTTDLSVTKENVAEIWSIITHKPVTSGSEEFKVKINATRILLHILNTGLDVEENWINSDLYNTIRAIRDWRDHKRDNIDGILEEFANYLMKRLEHNLTRKTRNEINVFITAIMRGNMED